MQTYIGYCHFHKLNRKKKKHPFEMFPKFSRAQLLT